MFTQKRKNYKTFIYTAIILTLCLLIIAIAWPTPPEDKYLTNQDESVNTGIPSKVNEVEDRNYNNENNNNQDECDEEEREEDNFPIVEKPNMPEGGESYYLVKKAGDAVKVFFIDHSGNEVELETTSILYDLLSVDDQKLFEEGYKVGSQEELAMLLQDFES